MGCDILRFVSPRNERVLLILADISGYTRFMVASQLALVHGQQVVTALLEAILGEVDFPLEVHQIEGDAVFLYALHPGDDEGWERLTEEVGGKLFRFFEAFARVLVAESESTLCVCEVCNHLHQLKLKIVVHSGNALFHQVGDFSEISGVDVILAHRLLKNSVEADEYILMTDAAARDLRLAERVPIERGVERVPEIGEVETFVHRPDPAFAEARSRFFQGPVSEMLGTTLGGGLREVRGQFATWSRGDPVVPLHNLQDSPKRNGAVSGLVLLLMTPFQLLLFPLLSSARALFRRFRISRAEPHRHS